MQTQMITSDVHPSRGNVDDEKYRLYLARVQQRFDAALMRGPLFQTDAGENLWEAYLDAYHPDVRPYHNCNACRKFIEHFGGLVTIDEHGATQSALWDLADCNRGEEDAIAKMLQIVNRANVTGPFLATSTELGTAVTGAWRHLAVEVPKRLVCSADKANQRVAEKREDFKTVLRALREFPAAIVNQALGLLKSEALFRSEKVVGAAQWLSALHTAIERAPLHGHGRLRENVVWRFVAEAPAGFCHPRSSMIGTLLEDIAAGKSFEQAARSFRVKMDPMFYQRPQAPPTAGNIARAEKLVEELGIAPSLARRFARVEELHALWKPAAPRETPAAGGVFGHLLPTPPAARVMDAKAGSITWEKFARVVLPEAKRIETLIPYRGPFFAILTAVDADAPPILQWDRPERRNPFSWYTHRDGSPAVQWLLTPGEWRDVTAITLNPSGWFEALSHHAKAAIAVIAGARDTQRGQGSAIFPETLRSELHEVRATIEAFSRKAELAGREEATACGLTVVGATFRVTDGSGCRTEYWIDRWD
jgi:hypothetical protein